MAYEPVWAIGTGIVPSSGQIEDVHGFLRRRLEGLLSGQAAGVRLLYGGSVKPDNAGVIGTLSNVDGMLVGGASLKAETVHRDRGRLSLRLRRTAGAP